MFRIHLLLFFGFFFLGRHTVADSRKAISGSTSCIKEISGENRERISEIEKALSLLLEPSTESDLAETMGAIDQALTAHIYEETRGLSRLRFERLITALQNAEIDKSFNIFTPGAVQYGIARSPYFLYRRQLAGHPVLRLILAHEISHFTRLDALGDVPPEESYRYIQREIQGRYLGVYREELYAFRAQYRFTKRAFFHQPINYWLKLFNQDEGYTVHMLHSILRESYARSESAFAKWSIRASEIYRARQRNLEADRRLERYFLARTIIAFSHFLDLTVPKLFGVVRSSRD